MTSKMTVVCLKDTGHVVAGVIEPPSGPPKLEELVGEAFPLRNKLAANPAVDSDATFALPLSMLEVKSVPLDVRAIARPQSFVVNGGAVVEVSASAGVPTIVPKTGGSVATFGFGGTVGQDTKVVAIIRSDSDPRIQRIQSGLILAGKQDVDLTYTIVPRGPPASLAPGAYFEALAAAGKPIAYDAAVVT